MIVVFGLGFQEREVRSKSLLSSESGDDLNDVDNNSRDLETGSPLCKIIRLRWNFVSLLIFLAVIKIFVYSCVEENRFIFNCCIGSFFPIFRQCGFM